jgi:polyhydroxybutyrate depolymerase
MPVRFPAIEDEFQLRVEGFGMRRPAIAFALCVLLAGCSGSGESEGAESGSPTSAASSTTVETATSTTETETTTSDEPADGPANEPRKPVERRVTVAGEERTFFLFVPSSVDTSEPAPLVLNLHGSGGRAPGQISLSGFNTVAETEGIVVAYPTARGGQWTFLSDEPDVDFMDAIINDVSEQLSVDTTRVYAIGFSQGGDFSTSLPCRRPGMFAAVASVSVLNHHTTPTCSESAPSAVLSMVGTADGVYSIEEGLTEDVPDPDPPGPLADEVAGWVSTNQCDPEPDETTTDKDVVVREYSCEAGALVVMIHSGGHIWPAEDGVGLDANAAIWDFLSKHSNTE